VKLLAVSMVEGFREVIQRELDRYEQTKAGLPLSHF